jgi:glycosyltransferase involved in cell wall biosynthesis
MPHLLIVYQHVSPHQVPALLGAEQALCAEGIELTVAEQFAVSRLHGWTLADVPRPPHWVCACPDDSTATSWAAFQAIRRMVRQRGVDVVAVNGWADPVSWGLALDKLIDGTRTIVVSDSTEVDRPRVPLKEAGKRSFLRLIDAAFAAGSRQRRYLERLGVPPARITTGCDVVDNARFAVSRLADRGSTWHVVIGTAARLVPEKNLEAALEAFSLVCRELPGGAVVWRLAGRGPLEGLLRTRAHELGVPLELGGFVTYQDMPAFYAGLDLYWQPSLSEPWGLAINEAMASGLPVLASDRCGSVDDLVSPENGWIHDATVAGMAQALRRALAERQRWPSMGCASVVRIGSWTLERFATGLVRAAQIALGARSSHAVAEENPDRVPEPGLH